MTLTRMGVIAAMLISVGVAAQNDNPDQVTDGEQRVEINGDDREMMETVRRALANVPGVAEVTGRRAAIFRLEPGATLAYSTIKAAIDGAHGAPIVRPPRLGFNLTVHIVFKEGQVTPEQVPQIIDAMTSDDAVTEVAYVSGRTMRIKTAAWSLRNQRGFNVMDVVIPAARATGYRGPGAPTYDRFVEDIIFQPSN